MFDQTIDILGYVSIGAAALALVLLVLSRVLKRRPGVEQKPPA